MIRHIVLLGYGTVGSGVYEMIENDPQLSKRVVITKIFVRDVQSRGHLSHHQLFTAQSDHLFDDADVVIEALGHLEPANQLIREALSRGIPVVTANKEVMNTHFSAFLELASRYRTHILYEAAVMAGIPVIKTLHQDRGHIRIARVEGIMNGATNFVLSKIFDEGVTFEEAKALARKRGFLETDPTDDFSGLDAMRKISILAKMIYGTEILDNDVLRVDFKTLPEQTISLLKNQGFGLKQIATLELKDHHVYAAVIPTVIDQNHPLFDVTDEDNRVIWTDENHHQVTLSGKGAGKIPSAQGIISDLELLLDGHPYHHDPTNPGYVMKPSNHRLDRWLIDIDRSLFPEVFMDMMVGHLLMTRPMSYEELKPYLSNSTFLAKVGF